MPPGGTLAGSGRGDCQERAWARMRWRFAAELEARAVAPLETYVRRWPGRAAALADLAADLLELQAAEAVRSPQPDEARLIGRIRSRTRRMDTE